MSTDEYYSSTSWSDNWLWQALTLIVHTICQNTAYRNQLFLMVFPSKFNTPLKRAEPQKRFKCEAITQTNWEQQTCSNLSYLKPELKS